MIQQSIALPFPVSLNNAFAQNRATGRRYRTKRYRAWSDLALWRIKIAKLKRMAGPVRVEIGLTPPDARKRDADNLVKPILDVLVKAGILADDSSATVRAVSVGWTSDETAGAVVKLWPA